MFPGDSLGPAPIAGVDTDVAGMVGVTETGPTTTTLVRSWREYQDQFGDFIDRPPFVTPYWRLPYAVRGFFENGGRRLYIARVLDGTATAGAGDLDAVTGDDPNPAARRGIAALMAVPEIALVAAPDDVAAPAFADALIDRCETTRDRFAIVNAIAAAGGVAPHRDTAFAALYHPALHVPAPHLPAGYAVVPPCGHVAGLLAAAAVASGSQQSNRELDPASLADHPNGAAPLEHVLSAAEAGVLVAAGVNVILDFRAWNRGIRLWSVRTMSSDPEWKYVNVRRYFIYLEQSIDKGLQWVVFEPNTEATWAAVRRLVSDFLFREWRNGVLAGRTPDEAFFVKCDRTTMTQEDIDNGRLVALVGIAPVRPAEFVIFRIEQVCNRQ